MISTKLLRLPQRGALGNGLRVVAGAVLASEGTLTVITRNQRLQLRPERDGSTTVVSARPVKFPIGTRVEIVFGPALSDESESDNAVLRWARLAIELGRGSTYAGKTSPWWYDTPQFHELLSAGDDRPVRELVSQLDGCSGAKAGEIVAEAGLSRGICREVTTKQAEKLLLAARANAKQVKAKRLGAVGDIFSNDAYAVAYGEAEFGAAAPRAEIPYAVEVWASRPDDIDDDDVTMYVNRARQSLVTSRSPVTDVTSTCLVAVCTTPWPRPASRRTSTSTSTSRRRICRSPRTARSRISYRSSLAS